MLPTLALLSASVLLSTLLLLLLLPAGHPARDWIEGLLARARRACDPAARGDRLAALEARLEGGGPGPGRDC